MRYLSDLGTRFRAAYTAFRTAGANALESRAEQESHLYLVKPIPDSLLERLKPNHDAREARREHPISYFPTAVKSRSIESLDDIAAMREQARNQDHIVDVLDHLNYRFGTTKAEHRVGVGSLYRAIERDRENLWRYEGSNGVTSFMRQVVDIYNSSENGRRLTNAQVVERVQKKLWSDGYRGKAFTQSDMYTVLKLAQDTRIAGRVPRVAWKGRKPAFTPVRLTDLVKGQGRTLSA